MEGTLRRQALGDLQAVDGMHPGEILGHGARLVSLQTSDEMPSELAAGEFFDLRQAFLEEILAEIFYARARRLIDCCAALALRNGQKRDGIDTSGDCPTGLCDTTLSGLGALRAILRKG